MNTLDNLAIKNAELIEELELEENMMLVDITPTTEDDISEVMKSRCPPTNAPY